MPDFNEDLLQFIWQNKLLLLKPFIAFSGNEIKILKYGELNKDAGPDFFNAQIIINGITLAGNIELHLKTSDWLKHKHQNNKSFDNIILHAVYEHDVEIPQNKKNNVEVLELKNLIHSEIVERYTEIFSSKEKLLCAQQFPNVDELRFKIWMERMIVERLEYKVRRLKEWFTSTGNNYAETFYISLLRNFGFNVNAQPFELIAHYLPISILLKHANNLNQLNAMLLGVSGILDQVQTKKEMRDWQNEFEFLKSKYKLPSLRKELFKYSRMRPANFPHHRLIQFANLIHKNQSVFSSPHKFRTYEELKVILEKSYLESNKLKGEIKKYKLGDDSIESILINSFAPFFFFYSKETGNQKYADAAFDLLQKCKFENNVKTRLYSAKQQLVNNGAGSQGLLNLYDNYCHRKKCLNCGIAVSIMRYNKNQ